MKVGIFTDAHGDFGMSHVKRWMNQHPDMEAAIVTGDVYDYYTVFEKPVHVIAGNHDPQWYNVKAKGRTSVIMHDDWTTFELGGLKFGVLGRMDEDTTKDLPVWLNRALGLHKTRSFVKKELTEGAEVFAGCDVLLFHDSPYPLKGHGLDGKPYVGGSHYLTDLVKSVKPKVVFHGHHHVKRFRTINDTKVYGLPPIDPSFPQGYCVLDTATCQVDFQAIAETW